MARGPDEGLRLLDDSDLAASLDSYHLYHATRADLHRRAGHSDEAADAYERALALATNDVERAYLKRRLHEVA
jgi:RNA polymerase sigma-70 factor (ECF subfamily)